MADYFKNEYWDDLYFHPDYFGGGGETPAGAMVGSFAATATFSGTPVPPAAIAAGGDSGGKRRKVRRAKARPKVAPRRVSVFEPQVYDPKVAAIAQRRNAEAMTKLAETGFPTMKKPVAAVVELRPAAPVAKMDAWDDDDILLLLAA